MCMNHLNIQLKAVSCRNFIAVVHYDFYDAQIALYIFNQEM